MVRPNATILLTSRLTRGDRLLPEGSSNDQPTMAFSQLNEEVSKDENRATRCLRLDR